MTCLSAPSRHCEEKGESNLELSLRSRSMLKLQENSLRNSYARNLLATLPAFCTVLLLEIVD